MAIVMSDFFDGNRPKDWDELTDKQKKQLYNVMARGRRTYNKFVRAGLRTTRMSQINSLLNEPGKLTLRNVDKKERITLALTVYNFLESEYTDISRVQNTYKSIRQFLNIGEYSDEMTGFESSEEIKRFVDDANEQITEYIDNIDPSYWDLNSATYYDVMGYYHGFWADVADAMEEEFYG